MSEIDEALKRVDERAAIGLDAGDEKILAAAYRAKCAEVEREHELFLSAHRDNMKGATLLMEMRSRAEKAESRLSLAENVVDLARRIYAISGAHGDDCDWCLTWNELGDSLRAWEAESR